jgi:hypothetical protein
MIKRLELLLRRVISGKNHSRKFPELTDRDVLLISYPRSGNTWVRFLLANILKPREIEIDFHNVHLFIPELNRNNDIIEVLVPPRIIKTHVLFKPEFPRVIYLVRDGRDVYVSYYHYRLKQLEDGTTFGDFLRRKDHFPSRWKDHVESWLNAGLPEKDFLVVRYENLLEDPLSEMVRMVNFVGLDASDDAIIEAIENSRFEKMKEIDQTKGRKYNLTGTKDFVRKGQAGSWRDEFSKEEIRYFKDTAGDLLIRLGYEKNLDW